MARGRAAGYDDQREMILEQAGLLFARRGYPATSMNQVAEACGLSKATLYHYYKDKYTLLVNIAEAHVTRLAAIVEEVAARGLEPEARMRELILSLVREYATAQSAHRVLTEDVKFLEPEDRQRVLDQERAVVRGFAQAVVALRPDLEGTVMGMPLTMLLFGMINWMFTWMKPEGPLGYEDMAPVVADLFLGGLPAVQVPATRPGV
ncbi:MAG: TetR/AcrR family transcriptional regulator [Rhodocyclaceae bacterium]|nr:TetR/AcrR family transcriptional regulator [Pseudomonadota bacterium]MDQ7974004.1 TetR/AcrR family transcriptional regulator [Rhodocyclaceae bacterium]MDQ8000839.1 TetR/AcrR family transcriptional regulator [Pseudomonadota bacterium]MDQ8018757.1 TetR/AcrR family transcriptional regulator [Pseudomonadota bacterium]